MSSSSLRERKKQRTRWLIQEQALRLFREQGYEQTTVDQIAAAADISPSTFFRYFKTKEDVVLEDEYDPMVLELVASAPKELSPFGAFRYAISELSGNLDEGELTKILERTKLILSVPALRMRTLDSLTTQMNTLAGGIAGRLGVPADDLRPRVMAGALFGASLAVMLAWAQGDGRDDLYELVDRALAALDEAGKPMNAPAAPGAAGAPQGR